MIIILRSGYKIITQSSYNGTLIQCRRKSSVKGGKEANAVTKVCEYVTSSYHFQNNIDVCFTFSIKLFSMSEIVN